MRHREIGAPNDYTPAAEVYRLVEPDHRFTGTPPSRWRLLASSSPMILAAATPIDAGVVTAGKAISGRGVVVLFNAGIVPHTGRAVSAIHLLTLSPRSWATWSGARASSPRCRRRLATTSIRGSVVSGCARWGIELPGDQTADPSIVIRGHHHACSSGPRATSSAPRRRSRVTSVQATAPRHGSWFIGAHPRPRRGASLGGASHRPTRWAFPITVFLDLPLGTPSGSCPGWSERALIGCGFRAAS